MLFRKGDNGDYFYIIKSGYVELVIDDSNKKVLHPMMTFGELALIERNKRTATVQTFDKEVELYALEGVLFREIVKKINQGEMKDRLLFITVVPIFSKSFIDYLFN